MATTMPLGRRERMTQWWQLRSRREQLVLLLVGTLAAVALLWSFVWQPLVRDTERLSRALADGRAALAEARRQSDEIAGLARNAPAAPAGDARTAIDGAMSKQGFKPAGNGIERVGDQRWRATLDAISFNSLTTFIDALQRDAGVRATEVSVTARVEPGQVRADVTLARD
jgi:general secretion pathway protein M